MSKKNNEETTEIVETPETNIVVSVASRVSEFFRSRTGKAVTFLGVTIGAGIATYMLGFRDGATAEKELLTDLLTAELPAPEIDLDTPPELDAIEDFED